MINLVYCLKSTIVLIIEMKMESKHQVRTETVTRVANAELLYFKRVANPRSILDRNNRAAKWPN